MTNPSRTDPKRGELWLLQFDPTRGSEVRKTRPAVILSPASVGRLPLRIVVPVTGWSPGYGVIPWLVKLAPDRHNNLQKESAADAFQVKSVSVERFTKRLGVVRADDLEEICAAVALCIGA